MSKTMFDDLDTRNRHFADDQANPDNLDTDPDAASVIPAAPRRDDSAHEPVVVRRHASLSAVIGLGASLLSALYLVRAAGEGTVLSWAIGFGLAVLAAFHLTQWVDARTPLLVLDATGVRLRLGNVWHGLLWHDVSRVTVQPRQGLFRDGKIAVQPADEAAALTDLGRRSRRRLAANTRMYGAPFALPLGLTTVTSTQNLGAAVEALAPAHTRVEVSGPPARTSAASEAEPATRPHTEPSTRWDDDWTADWGGSATTRIEAER